MAQNIEIREVTYPEVPSIEVPIAGSNTKAVFVETSDATLNNAAHLPAGESAYANGVKYTGTAPKNDSDDLTVSGATVTAPAGFYEDPVSKSVANGSATAPASISGTSATVTTGTNTLTLTKSVPVTPDVTPGYVASGTAGNTEVTLTAPVTTKDASTITPGTSAQEIPAGTYLTGKQTVAGDPNLVASKIVYPNSIFGVAGTAKLPVISQDATTKVLTIS